MTGRAEVARQQRQLDTTFSRARGLHADVELLSDFARYLCVLVSGYVEQTTIELLIEYARTRSDPHIQRHVERSVRRQVTNLNAQRLIEVVSTFDPAWRNKLEKLIVDEYKDALDGIVDLRNSVAHGRYVGVTFSRVDEYYIRVKKIIGWVADVVIPRPGMSGT